MKLNEKLEGEEITQQSGNHKKKKTNRPIRSVQSHALPNKLVTQCDRNKLSLSPHL